MREREIEQRLVKAVKKMGGMCPKFVSPGLDGMPDRIVLMPNGKIGFVEIKATGKKPQPLQGARMKQLQELGFKTVVLDRVHEINNILEVIQNG